jgi:hypothetical protein
MIEIIKHTFGFCGEHWHPNIFTFMLVFSTPFSYIIYIIKNKFKNKRQ